MLVHIKPLSIDPELKARLAALPRGSTLEEHFSVIVRWGKESAREQLVKEINAPSGKLGD